MKIAVFSFLHFMSDQKSLNVFLFTVNKIIAWSRDLAKAI